MNKKIISNSGKNLIKEILGVMYRVNIYIYYFSCHYFSNNDDNNKLIISWIVKHIKNILFWFKRDAFIVNNCTLNGIQVILDNETINKLNIFC